MTARATHKCLWIATALAGLALPAMAQEVQNPAARRTPADTRNLLEGRWNGANLERRTACSAAQNNGNHGTYAEYNVTFDRGANLMGIDETAITGLRCTYLGTYVDDRFQPQWNGSYSCNDGKTGTFALQNFLATSNAMSIRLSIQLNGTETCSIDSILGGSRF